MFRDIGRRVAVAAISLLGLGLLGSGCSAGSASTSAVDSAGPVTFAAADPHGSTANLVTLWNAAHPGEQVQLHRLPTDAAAQHADLLQNLARPESGYDLAALPTADTAEFAAQGWLRPLTGRYRLDTASLLPAPVAAASYRGKLVAAPWDVDTGVLYYRRDLVGSAPTTWKQLTAACAKAHRLQIGCYGTELAKGPDLTANVVEAVGSAGGQLLRPDGSTGDLDAPGVRNGLQFLADSYRDGTIPKAAITYQASQASQAFKAGSLLFMRNWTSSLPDNHQLSHRIEGLDRGVTRRYRARHRGHDRAQHRHPHRQPAPADLGCVHRVPGIWRAATQPVGQRRPRPGNRSEL